MLAIFPNFESIIFSSFGRDSFLKLLDKALPGKTILTTLHGALLGRVAQSVTCLATNVSLTADPGLASLIPAQSHSFVEIDHEIISTVILLPSAESFKKGFCQLQGKVCSRSTG